MSTIDLYNPKEKSAVRERLLKEQGNVCAITKLPLTLSDSVLEHAHDKEMFVRGVVSRQANSCLGVIENAWKRYLQWWYSGTISEFLRQVADYLELPKDKRYRHDQWVEKIQTRFNNLPEGLKRGVLQNLGEGEGGNSIERKKMFKSVIMRRKHTFEELVKLIDKQKELK